METLGRGLGSNIAIDPSSAVVLEDRELFRKTLKLVEILEARPLPLDPYLAELRREMEEEEAAKVEVWEDDEDDEDDDANPATTKIKNITDLRPAEMARLEYRFKDEHGAGRGLRRDEFEAVMREFTGMAGKMGGQLFCKIDANDDGTVEWDEFLDYIVHEAGSKLDAGKHLAGCTVEPANAPMLFCQPKDMVGAHVLCKKQRIIVSVGLVRREVVFWNLDTLTKAGEANIPTISQVDSRRPFTLTKSVSSRSIAYLPSTLGSVFLCSGTETMIVQYDCRRFRVQRHLFTPQTPSCMSVAWNPSVTRTATNLEAGSWLIVGDIEGDVTVYNCKTLEQVGKYHAHNQGFDDTRSNPVTSVAFWPQGGIVSCGEDGRVVVADYHLWKVKDYFSSEKLQTVEMVLQIVTDARNCADAVGKADSHAAELQTKAAVQQEKVDDAKMRDKRKMLPDLLKALEEAKDQVCSQCGLLSMWFALNVVVCMHARQEKDAFWLRESARGPLQITHAQSQTQKQIHTRTNTHTQTHAHTTTHTHTRITSTSRYVRLQSMIELYLHGALQNLPKQKTKEHDGDSRGVASQNRGDATFEARYGVVRCVCACVRAACVRVHTCIYEMFARSRWSIMFGSVMCFPCSIFGMRVLRNSLAE